MKYLLLLLCIALPSLAVADSADVVVHQFDTGEVITTLRTVGPEVEEVNFTPDKQSVIADAPVYMQALHLWDTDFVNVGGTGPITYGEDTHFLRDSRRPGNF